MALLADQRAYESVAMEVLVERVRHRRRHYPRRLVVRRALVPRRHDGWRRLGAAAGAFVVVAGARRRGVAVPVRVVAGAVLRVAVAVVVIVAALRTVFLVAVNGEDGRVGLQ